MLHGQPTMQHLLCRFPPCYMYSLHFNIYSALSRHATWTAYNATFTLQIPTMLHGQRSMQHFRESCHMWGSHNIQISFVLVFPRQSRFNGFVKTSVPIYHKIWFMMPNEFPNHKDTTLLSMPMNILNFPQWQKISTEYEKHQLATNRKEWERERKMCILVIIQRALRQHGIRNRCVEKNQYMQCMSEFQ